MMRAWVSRVAMTEPGRAWLGRTAWARRSAPLRAFIRTESGSAGVLVAAVAAALVWANVDGSSYASVWRTELALRLGSHAVTHDLRTWINSGLMTLFFLVVGLEARREFDLGDLRERRRFVLPFAVGPHGLVSADVWFLRCSDGSTVAYREHTYGGELVEEYAAIERLQRAYDTIRDLALTPAETRKFILRMLEEVPCDPST